jgi:cell division septation protein DedD
LALPVKNTLLATDVDQQIPEVVDAGEVIDVDQPESAEVSTKKTLLPTDTSKTQVLDSSIKKKSDEVKSSTVADTDNEITFNDTINSEPVSISEDVLAKAKYSIQVGMYGSLVNAEMMVEKLRIQNLHAYVSDYINKKNEVRFNVKFGYFPNKKIANTALNDYIDIQSGDGYLVNFTVDYLTHTEVASSSVRLDEKLESGADNSLKKSQGSDTDAVTTTPEILTKTQLKNTEAKLVEDADKLLYN